jgi:hypothetical protein
MAFWDALAEGKQGRVVLPVVEQQCFLRLLVVPR